MNKQTLIYWLKQRPWLIVPVLGLIPLIGIPVLNQTAFAPEERATPASPILPTTIVTLPTIAPSPLPSPQPTPTPVAQTVQKSAVAAQKVTSARSNRVEAIQSAINLSVDAAIQIRVLLHQATASLTLGTSAGGDVIDVQSGKRLQELSAGSSYDMQAEGKTILVGSARLPSLVWVDPIAGGVTVVGDRAYRGRLLIASSDSRLWVVNYVNLQQYLYSVVGAEVSPSWPIEALKAQAVAARSYALTYHLKPVKRDLYDLGSDEYYQVYKGIESEASATRKAVNSTSGEFVSYRGGVVESLYAATDDIVMEAFQGRGMSQIGALGLAERGQSYRQILGAYYSGTGIGRIEMDIE